MDDDYLMLLRTPRCKSCSSHSIDAHEAQD